MTRLRLIALGVACFLSGIVFVIACGDGDGTIDAGERADAASCDMCEPPLTAQRVYQVRDTASQVSGTIVASSAACLGTGDILLSGGCFAHVQGANSPTDNDGNLHPLLDFGPAPPVGTFMGTPASYTCIYENNENFGFLVVVATAICLDTPPLNN
jgi:hypothetical protein